MNGWVSDADSIENLVQVVGHEAIARPLGKECDGNDDPHAPSVSGSREKGLISDICRY